MLLCVALVLAGVAAWQRRGHHAAGPAPQPVTAAQADAAAQAAAGEAGTAGAGSGRGRGVPAAAPVPDVPAAWRRIARTAATWPAPDAAPVIGAAVDLPTVPASRMRDVIGVNIDVWRNEAAYARWPELLGLVRALHLRHARVNMQSRGGYGLTRMQQLGRAGVRLDVIMGDAFGRYGTAPYAALATNLRQSVLPYVDAVEGTNEPDLTRRPDWPQRTRAHQDQILRTAEPDRGRPIGVIAPSVGRLTSVAQLGDVRGQADAANAHAYASGGEPGGSLAQWLAAMRVEAPEGPTIVTEAGFQTDVGQRKYHTPTSPQAAAAYVPRTILEAIRRGVPQVYLYELADRGATPSASTRQRTSGCSGMTSRPSLLDRARPATARAARRRPSRPCRRTGHGDGATRAGRSAHARLPQTDGPCPSPSGVSAPVWDGAAARAITVDAEEVRIALDARTAGALETDVVSGARRRLSGADGTVAVALAGNPVIVTGLRPAR